jgi:hypothetical protein
VAPGAVDKSAAAPASAAVGTIIAADEPVDAVTADRGNR